MSSVTVTLASLPRPSTARSNTMPSIQRTLSVFRASISSSKGLRRLSGLRHRQDSAASSVTVRPSTSFVDDSVPVFTVPDYKQPTPSRPPPEECSPLTVTRPRVRRSMTLPSSVRAMSSKALARLPAHRGVRGVCDISPRKPSVVAVDSPSSIRTVSTTSGRRRSSLSSVESFSSSEENVTLWLKLQAFPSGVLGLLTSIVCVPMIFLLPALSAPAPKRKFALRPCERETVLTDEQERNPPRLPRSGVLSPLSRRLTKRTPKQLRAVKPTPVDPKTLSSE